MYDSTMKAYWENRKESTITEIFGSYRLKIRYFANCNFAQVTMENVAELRFPLLWSIYMNDVQANAALTLFKSIGYFDIQEGVTA